MSYEPAIRDHDRWINYLQPDGLVVSSSALVDAQVVLDRTAAVTLQQQFLDYTGEVKGGDEAHVAVTDLPRLLREFLAWPNENLYGLATDRPIPESLKIPLREFGETLEPTAAFAADGSDGNPAWLLLVKDLPRMTDLDDPVESKMSGWSASPSRRFERLLREAGVPIGLLSNSAALRLMYAPRGENAGTLTFPVGAMTEVAGRPILGAFHMLLRAYQLLAAPSEARLPALLKRSRDYQARVSTELAQQVLDALYELLRGFQAAHGSTKGQLLKQVLADDPDQVYAGLLSVLMRMVFLLYAEDQGLMPSSDVYVRNYAVHGLFERLRADHEQFADTMESRYGAWAQLVALFRTVHGGCKHPLFRMPARHGHLFDPDRYPFLEGRTTASEPVVPGMRLPLVPDGTIYRVLEKLLILDGQRLSYRTLDVEQIGSVYETMMGFRLEQAAGTTVALRPAKAHGAPVPVNLDELLEQPAKDRARFLEEATDYKLPPKLAEEVKKAGDVDELLIALERRIARNATPQPAPKRTMLLIPTDERRRSGSHYTPRSLTEPIVRTTLRPVLKQLTSPSPSQGEGRGEGVPTPDQILNLKVCDMACGSGAFLVEACRQLAEKLVAAWATHGGKPVIPPDEDELLHARRLVAQRCLYGVDKNPMAVDLAKLSLWLATLAKDHPFTFVDHALRAGDSLVGLMRRQIVGFDLAPSEQLGFVEAQVRNRMERATAERRAILEAGDDMPPLLKRQKLSVADEALDLVRLAGDAVVASFFAGSKAKERKQKRDEYFGYLRDWLEHTDAYARMKLDKAIRELCEGDKPITPFHWEIEFPEVFAGDKPGFDAIVGNPPFAGKNTLINSNREHFLDWLKTTHEESHGNADLVAHFFRRAFNLLHEDACFGLIATNTIGQGDTRSTGLRWICTHEGTIYSARKRLKWPGQAAVVVSVVHVCHGWITGPYLLNGSKVPIITAYLFHAGGHDDAIRLLSNAGKGFQGPIPLGMGFTFDDNGSDDETTSLDQMRLLISRDPRNAERVFPYIGGEEINDSPTHSHHRFVINFGEMSLEEAARWPDLLAIIERKVKPQRNNDKREIRRKYWWRFGEVAPALNAATRALQRVLVHAYVSPHLAFTFVPTNYVVAGPQNVFAIEDFGPFCALQCRTHEVWARFFAATLKDDLSYTRSDCFETFPFPNDVEHAPKLDTVGKEYYEFRARLMVKNNEGLTKTYNRFHDPSETSPDIAKLRELHDAMDRAVLDAYGWTDIRPTCEFILEYEDEEEDADTGSLMSPARRQKKKPYRYRWPDDIRDEVLARLLKLNADRAAEERRSGLAASAAEATKGKRGAKKRAAGTKARKPHIDQQKLSGI